MRKILLLLAVLAVVLPSSARADSGTGDVQLAESLMQCMERCIREEGSDEKATCKSRCANVSSQAAPARDCGSEYKSCRRACNKDKACEQACREARRNCF